MKKIIICGSHYGTTKQYATELSRRLGIELVEYSKLKSLSEYDTIVYMGALYAGGVLGLKETVKLLPSAINKKIYIVTVGLADPKDDVNISNIRNSIKQQVPPDVFSEAHFFHLRGGIDYKRINFKHKFMMRLLYNKVKKIPVEEQDAETKAMIATYNKEVNFVDFDSLNEIIESVQLE